MVCKNYWFFLHSDVLFRIHKNKDLNCNCTFCQSEKIHLENLLRLIENDGHIDLKNPPKNFTKK